MTDKTETPQALCGHCQRPIAESYRNPRHFGWFVSHQEDDCIQILKAEIAKLKRTLRESQKDAERYRWLKENDGDTQVAIYWNIGHDWVSSEDLDRSVDAAIPQPEIQDEGGRG